MIDKLSNKSKFYLVLVGFLFAIWLSYLFAFSRTGELRTTVKQRMQQLEGIQYAPKRLQIIRQQTARLDKLIGNVNGEETSPYLIEKAGRYCKENNLTLYEISPKHIFEKDGFAVATQKLIVQGQFKKLLKLLNDLEHHSEAGKLRSVTFESEYNFRTGMKELSGIYYIQSVGKINE